MIHVQPTSENSTNPSVTAVYADLKTLLRLKTIPPYFQYIAAFPVFLELLWLRLRPIVDGPIFQEAINNLTQDIRDLVTKEIPSSTTIELLLPKISDSTKKEMINEFIELERVNATLLFIAMLIRETIKGLKIRQQDTQRLASGINPVTQTGLVTINDQDLAEFESNALTLSHLSPDPFMVTYMQLVSELMLEFSKSKEYLALRVRLEAVAQVEVKKIWGDFNFHYQEIVSSLEHEPYADELIYLLHDAFPAYFPKQLLSALILELGLYPRGKVEQLKTSSRTLLNS